MKYTLKIRDKNIKFRKWKVKDRNKFLKNIDNPKALKEALVFDCLENPNIALSEEEFKYVLLKIREVSISEPIKYIFICEKCNKEYNFEAKPTDIIKPKYGKYTRIEYEGHSFQMGSIRNKDFYDECLQNAKSDEEKLIFDFILHVQSYNDNDCLSFKEMLEIINNLDIEVFEKIFRKWEEMRFRLDLVNEVTCPHCGHKELYEFDELPGFFPESWKIND